MNSFSRITGVSYNLYHCPDLALHYGSTPSEERTARPDSEYIKNIGSAVRSFSEAAAYPPNQAYIGLLDPLNLPLRPWTGNLRVKELEAPFTAPFGDLLSQEMFYGLLKFCDAFDLVLLESDFSKRIRDKLEALPGLNGADLASLHNGSTEAEIEEAVKNGALPLYLKNTIIGCVKSAHPKDGTLNAHIILENLSSKAGAAYAVLRLLAKLTIDAGDIDYIIETSEEACGDGNQRGGGNFAKAVGEAAGLINATGSDTRAFCAGPVHGLLQAASLVRAGTFKKIIVTAGGTTAKLGMNSRKHLEKGFPILEDCMGSFALLVESAGTGGLVIRNDVTGRHKIGSGSSPQHVIQNLVADPLQNEGLRFDDIDYYAPELHDPEVTENGGAGNVTLANLKMIAAMAVMKKQLERNEINEFINKHGSSGWAPTQGHIPSGIPALGWMLEWARSGRMNRGLVIGKGSLFLGRMTGLFDGVSILIENGFYLREEKSPVGTTESKSIRIGLTIPGSESDPNELYTGTEMAEKENPELKIIYYGTPDSNPAEARDELKTALENGDIDGALAFHYPFPLGTATFAPLEIPNDGEKFIIASSTGRSAASDVQALIMNAVAGTAVARAGGINNPSIGLLNVNGAAAALKALRKLIENGYPLLLKKSSRGDSLLRGNDLLKATVDVIVCDTFSGNAFVKIFSAFETGGDIETAGCGYGPALGGNSPIVSIISRTTSSGVVGRALVMTGEMIRKDLCGIYEKELQAAERAGLHDIISTLAAKKSESPDSNSKNGVTDKNEHRENSEKMIANKVVDREIEGLDVLELTDAVNFLLKRGVYCEAGMGCTGPVVLIAETDEKTGRNLLEEGGYI